MIVVAAVVNEAESAAWNAERGADWVRNQVILDALMSEVLELTITTADPGPGEAVLDIGCGAGATTLAAASRIGTAGLALGVDVSAPLISHAAARAQVEEFANASFELGDAQTHPFDQNRFDLLISRFGVMFFEDPKAAFFNMTRALRPSGRSIFAAWAGPEQNPWFAIPVKAATARLGPGDPADPTAPGPMAIRDINRVVGIMDAAGMVECSGEECLIFLNPPGSFSEVVDLAVSVGPVTRLMAARGGTEADRKAITEICRAGLGCQTQPALPQCSGLGPSLAARRGRLQEQICGARYASLKT